MDWIDLIVWALAMAAIMGIIIGAYFIGHFAGYCDKSDEYIGREWK